MSDSVELVRALARVVSESNLAELEYEKGDLRIRLVLEPEPQAGMPAMMPAVMSMVPPAALPAPAAAAPAAEDPSSTINSPLAGVFYRAPSPGAAPFVKEGDTVTAGQTLCIVEAMKLMNEITADASCRIVKVLVENTQVVEPGQALFRIEPL